MADSRNQLSRYLSVLVLVLFKGVTSNIEERDFDGNGLVPDVVHHFSRDEFPEYEPPLHPIENQLWQGPLQVGAISGVAVDPLGNPVIFHRASRRWNTNTFDENGEFQEKYRGPISCNTVLTLDRNVGDIIHSWGNHTFYLPHGIHIDNSGNVWLTDIALHQVFKYSSTGVLRLILGQRFVSGDDLKHFCQPTSVVVLSNGDIVVADGYCNSRIVLFDKIGNPKYSLGKDLWTPLRIPHALTVLPNGQVCIADRENWKIVCMEVSQEQLTRNPKPFYSIYNQQFGRIFGIASYRGFIYAVNGMTSVKKKIQGFTVDPLNQNVTDVWGPESSFFVTPHAIAVCPHGSALYVSEIGPNKVWKFDLVRA